MTQKQQLCLSITIMSTAKDLCGSKELIG